MDEITKRLLALGDEEEWNIFYNKYEAHIKKIVTNRVSDKNYVNDLVNEIFEIVYKAMDRFDTQYPIENWISRIAVFHCINHHRMQQSKGHTYSHFNFIELTNINVIDSFDCEQEIINKEYNNLIKRSFKEFSNDEKKILVYRIFKGYKYSEIENELKVNISTVKNVIRKHKLIFKTILN